jgi:hypothetical protein
MAEIVERTCKPRAPLCRRPQSRRLRGAERGGHQPGAGLFGTRRRTLRTIAVLQQEGTCWCGSTVWQGHTAMRISVSSWATTAEDVEKSLSAILHLARE